MPNASIAQNRGRRRCDLANAPSFTTQRGKYLKHRGREPHVPDLLRAFGPLNEAQRQELLANARAVLLKRHRKKKAK